MRVKERLSLVKWAEGLSDEELIEETVRALYDCLGSDLDEMYERGYDFSDIADREIYERFLGEKYDVLESVCLIRGIDIWT